MLTRIPERPAVSAPALQPRDDRFYAINSRDRWPGEQRSGWSGHLRPEPDRESGDAVAPLPALVETPPAVRRRAAIKNEPRHRIRQRQRGSHRLHAVHLLDATD